MIEESRTLFGLGERRPDGSKYPPVYWCSRSADGWTPGERSRGLCNLCCEPIAAHTTSEKR